LLQSPGSRLQPPDATAWEHSTYTLSPHTQVSALRVTWHLTSIEKRIVIELLIWFRAAPQSFGQHGREYITSEVAVALLQALSDPVRLQAALGPDGPPLPAMQQRLQQVVLKVRLPGRIIIAQRLQAPVALSEGLATVCILLS
jgi:hypothetical protein